MRTLRHGPYRAAALALALPASALIGCDEGTLATTTLQTTSNESGSNSNDGETALIVIGAVLLVSTAAGLVVFTVAESDAYLELHQQEIRRALASGDGAFVSDLAQALALPPALMPRLQAVLKGARATLDRPLAAGHIDRERAKTFGSELNAALKADPDLAPYVRGMVTRYGPLLARR